MRLSFAVALLLATAAAPALGQALPPPVPLAGDGPEDARLKRLFYDSDERDLKTGPLGAIGRGSFAATCAMRISSASI